MSTSAKVAKTYAEEAVEKYGRKSKTRATAQEEAKETPLTEKFADIEANPFHQIVMQSDAAPEEKQKAVAQALAYDETLSKEENAAKLASFEQFKEFLMAYRKEMSKEIIRLSDTETFGELQKVFEDMNQSLLDFESMITPLVEIIEAVNKLNMASDGAMYDIFKEIQEDKAEEERIAKLREEQEGKIDGYQRDIRRLNGDIAALREEKGWFGMGGITKSALQDIARKEEEIRGIRGDIRDLQTEITSTVVERESKYAEFAAEKDKLRELLDLTSEEHKERQEQLVSAALNFVNTMDDRTASVLTHMEGIRGQIGNVGSVNGQMSKIFAVISDGIKDAENVNRTLSEKFKVEAEDESTLDRLDREEKGVAVDEHVESLTSSKVDTLGTLGELQEEALNIRSMRETNRQQINSTRKMHSSGTAGVASRLSTVLTAVSSAALNEARTTTQNTLKGMNRITQEIAQSEAIKNATNLHIQNDEFAQAIEKLAGFKDISDQATEITRAAIEENKVLQGQMEQTARDLEQSIKELKGATADVMHDGAGDSRGKPAKEQDNAGGTAGAAAKFAGLNL